MSDELVLEVTVPASRAPRLAGVSIHRRDDNPAASVRRGIPVTSPLRVVMDLGSCSGTDLVEGAIDRGVAARLFTVAAVGAGEPDGPVAPVGRPSAAGDRAGRAGRPLPPRLRLARGPAGRRGRRLRPPLVLGELPDDRQRQNDLVLAGWTALHFTWEDVCQRPDQVAERVRRGLSASRPA